MNRLAINFIGRGARSPWAGRLLIAVALAVGLDAALSYRELSAALERSEARLAQGEGAPRAMPARQVAPAELAAARDTVQRLGMPWGRLFGALEAAASEQVALLAVEPDAKSGTVLISGDSKDYPAALHYVTALGRAEVFERVHLVRHELKAADSGGAVNFAVSAAWTGGRP